MKFLYLERRESPLSLQEAYFAKDFDKVPHEHLLIKIKALGIHVKARLDRSLAEGPATTRRRERRIDPRTATVPRVHR